MNMQFVAVCLRVIVGISIMNLKWIICANILDCLCASYLFDLKFKSDGRSDLMSCKFCWRLEADDNGFVAPDNSVCSAVAICACVIFCSEETGRSAPDVSERLRLAECERLLWRFFFRRLRSRLFLRDRERVLLLLRRVEADLERLSLLWEERLLRDLERDRDFDGDDSPLSI